MRPFVVGIAGGTASGKTTIATQAAARLGASILTHDRYYKSADASTNFDHPDSLDTARMVADLDRLRAGHAVTVPVYDFAVHRRADHEDPLAPSPILVVEGILVLSDADLRRRFDLCVFVDCPADLRLIRRVRRDMTERGRTLESILWQYLQTVRPMHEEFVQPSAARAALVLDGEGDLSQQVDRLLGALPL